jgi:alpha-beta hydrolase superfamily lysophospholipase
MQYAFGSRRVAQIAAGRPRDRRVLMPDVPGHGLYMVGATSRSASGPADSVGLPSRWDAHLRLFVRVLTRLDVAGRRGSAEA